jgi:hypothetical protein
VGAHATRRLTRVQAAGSDKEASMVVSWTVVSWIRQVVVALALMAFVFVGIEITFFLLAAAFLY